VLVNPPGTSRLLLLLLLLAELIAHAQVAVSIVVPTNNQVFYGTNTISVVAEASGATNVQIYMGTNLVGDSPGQACFAVLSNLPPATNPYVFIATSAASSGTLATSAPVSFTVRQSLPIAAGPVVLNTQTGVWQQSVTVSNFTPFTLSNGFRLYVTTSPTNARVVNATGTNASGVRYIDSPEAFATASSRTLIVQFLSGGTAPSTSYIADPFPFIRPKPTVSLKILSSDGAASVVEFPTASNWFYVFQHSTSLPSWKALPGVVKGTGARMAKTNSEPAAKEFFRAVALP
jgi:hypothetical protein